ncbi:MAG: recombinase RecF, partial [Sulfuricella sp.]
EAVEIARARLAEAESDRRAYDEAKRAADNAETATSRAAALNSQVAAWTALELALSPSGLPAELLARALGPLNAALERVHDASGWPLVRVEDDIAITAAGRACGLLSESERWRVDAALAYAAAEVSGCGLVLLDRFDVLDVRSRTQFIRLALAMDAQTIAAGTLKETPGAMPGKLQAVWLGG